MRPDQSACNDYITLKKRSRFAGIVRLPVVPYKLEMMHVSSNRPTGYTANELNLFTDEHFGSACCAPLFYLSDAKSRVFMVGHHTIGH